VFVAEGSKGFEAVTVAERDDPPAVFGSDLHKIAYPEDFARFESASGKWKKPIIMRQRARCATP